MKKHVLGIQLMSLIYLVVLVLAEPKKRLKKIYKKQ